ncbi:MAG: DNA cytosine methyltransferase [Patescibacteria group bacterium]|nr:DNA cytosine methyltransferase [Patescibacteria group bacterium]
MSKKNSLDRPNGFADQAQGTLFYEIVGIIREKKNKDFFSENVENLERQDNGITFSVIKETLEGLVYFLSYKCKGYYSTTQRKIFIVGFRDRNLSFSFPEIHDKKLAIKDILEKDVPEKYTLTNLTWRYLRAYTKKHKAKGNVLVLAWQISTAIHEPYLPDIIKTDVKF